MDLTEILWWSAGIFLLGNVPGSEKRTKPGIKEDIRYCAANDQRKRTPRFF